MAEFKIHELEGTRYVDVHLNHEMVRAESGALSYFSGDINIHSQLVPSLRGLIKSMLADEAVYRPTYTGTGVITLESSLGGFHLLDLRESRGFWSAVRTGRRREAWKWASTESALAPRFGRAKDRFTCKQESAAMAKSSSPRAVRLTRSFWETARS